MKVEEAGAARSMSVNASSRGRPGSRAVGHLELLPRGSKKADGEDGRVDVKK